MWQTMVDIDATLASSSNGLSSSHATRVHNALVDMNTIIVFVLHGFRLAHAKIILDDELGFWILPKSIAWFYQFLLHKYNDGRWVANFSFTKIFIFCMSTLLIPHCER